MKLILFWLASAVLATSAVAQSSVNSQTSTSAQSDTSAKASQSGVNASSQNSNSASQNSTVSTQGKKSGSNSGSAVSGSSHTQAGANASGVATFPSGINIPAVLSKSLDSKKNKEGDEVTAKTTADVLYQGKIIIPRNSKLIGHVTQARAKAKGESDSALGIAFDRAILKDGQSVPLHAAIQAIAAPVAAASATVNDDMYSGGGRSGSGAGPSGGAPVGGATGAVGSVAGGAAGTVRSAGELGSSAGSTLDATAGSAARVGSNAASLGGTLSSGTTGVIGLKNLQLASGTSSSANGSVITSTGKNVKLESGSQLILKVGASTDGQ